MSEVTLVPSLFNQWVLRANQSERLVVISVEWEGPVTYNYLIGGIQHCHI